MSLCGYKATGLRFTIFFVLPHAGFRFLTRLHYCAADTGTYGPQAPWGEHEMDYILFTQ